jgi:cbb3-type cytochrome oxidase subunit 3
MEWFVAIIFMIFIAGLIWVTVDAIKHANRSTARVERNSP